jgi:hypothetical protein
MFTKIMTVTPEMANRFLERNSGNRPIRRSHVRYFIECLKRGDWITTHQGIAFDETGKMVDGQHRCVAIVESGINAEIMVTWNATSESVIAMDIGLKRTFADVLKIDKRIAEPLCLAAKILDPRSGSMLPQELQEIAKTGLGEDIKKLVEHCGTTRKVFSCAAMKLAAAITHRWGYASEAYIHQQYAALISLDYDSMSNQSKALAKKVGIGKIKVAHQNEILIWGLKVFSERRSESSTLTVSKDDMTIGSDAVRYFLRYIEKPDPSKLANGIPYIPPRMDSWIPSLFPS